MSKRKDEESVCLTKVQIEHIVDAARDEPGACPKAKEFVNDLRPRKKKQIQKQKQEESDSPALDFVGKILSRKVSGKIRNIKNSILDLF